MIRQFGFVFCLFVGFSLSGQQKLIIHQSGNPMYVKEILQIDSIQLDGLNARLSINGGQSSLQIPKKYIDSITFTAEQVVLDKIYIIYHGAETATIINPYENRGVEITATGSTVVVNAHSGISDLEYNILGSTSDGSLSLTTDQKILLVLNNVTLVNSSGPSINILGNQKTSVKLTAGTMNYLEDGVSNTKNGTVSFSGPVTFDGSGALHVTGIKKHGIYSSSKIEIQSGQITVDAAASDGLHAEGILISGGSLELTSSGDGIDAGDGEISISGGSIKVNSISDNVKCIVTGKNDVFISGGNLILHSSGAQSKGISAKGNIHVSGAEISITISGKAVFTAEGNGFNASYATALKSDSLILIDGGHFMITVTDSANGGKCLSAQRGIQVTAGIFDLVNSGIGGTYTKSSGSYDTYVSSCITTDNDLVILGGAFHLIVSGSGGKGFSSDGNMTIGSDTGSPEIQITNSGTSLLVSGTSGTSAAEYTHSRCIKSEGVMTIKNGQIKLNANKQGGVCIESDSTMVISGANIECQLDGNQSRGLEAARNLSLISGQIVVKATGGVVLETEGSGVNPSYCAAVHCDEDVLISGSQLTITGSGAGFKGVSSDQNILMSSGTVMVTSSGSGNTYTTSKGIKDAFSSSALSSDSSIIITGGNLTTICSGNGGKGLKADQKIIIGNDSGGPVTKITTTGARFLVSGTDYSHPKAIVSVGPVIINNGDNIIISSDDGIHSDTSVTIRGGNNVITANSNTKGVGEGVEAPTITFAGGVTNIQASNDGINATYGTVSGGTEMNDNSNVFIQGGVVIVAGSDAIDSNGNITITGGTTIVCGPTSAPEEGVDFNGTFNIHGGLLICGGSNSNMTKAMNSTSTQKGLFLKSSSQLAASSILHIEDANGQEIVSYRPLNGVNYFHFSSGDLKSATAYKVYFGGVYNGGAFVGNSKGWGLYSGGSYSNTGATLKSSFTTSATGSVTTVTF